MEDASRFENSGKNLSTKGRPKQVGAWVARSRGKRHADTEVTDPVEYAGLWQAWWDSLQPGWRKKGADGKWVVGESYGVDGKEWGEMYRWGVNGLLNVVASLYFWGCAVVEDAEHRGAWEAAVADVGWMMEGMA
ncbi:hypothetical protein DFH09DRAFT_810143, partial [Mycena vulgaris]